MTELVKYEAACRAVAEAASIDEAKDLRDQSEAMRAYARQAKNKDLEVKAAEIRIRAERRIGELMAAQRDGGDMSAGGRPSEKTGSKTNPVFAPPTLAEVGIDKKLADRARKYANIPEEEFNGIVDDWKDRIETENKRVTVNLIAAGEKAEQAAAEKPEQPDPHAKLRKEFRAMTDEAQEDDWIGLREEVAGLRKRVAKQRSEIADLKAAIKELTSDDDAGRKIGNLQRRMNQSKGRSAEHQKNAARLQRQVNAQKAQIDILKRKLEAQEIEIQ